MTRVSAAALALFLAPLAAAAEGEFGVLVDEPGAETTYFTCSVCHSERLVAQQGLTRERWDHLLDWMVEEQGMQPLDPEDREVVLDYLAEHYNTDRPNFPR
jgi:cytochrome c